MAEQSSPPAAYLLQLRCIFRFVPLFPAPHIKNPARQRRGQDSVLPKPGAGSLSVASGEIYFIDYLLAREVAAQVFETDVPYLSLGRRAVTEAAP